MTAKTKSWRTDKHMDVRASAEQIASWKRAAERSRMQLSTWVRLVLDEAAAGRRSRR